MSDPIPPVAPPVPPVEPAAVPSQEPETVVSTAAPTPPVMPPPTPARKSTLGITLVVGIIVLLLGFAALYWYNKQLSNETLTPSTAVATKTTTNTGTVDATATTSTTATISATPSTTGTTAIDVDTEIKALDNSVTTVTTTDFDSTNLADTSLGL